MEIGDGVFVSSVSTDDWTFDPGSAGETHVLVRDQTAYAGIERFRDLVNPLTFTLHERETILVLEGSARIEIEGGPTLELTAGDLASLPKGAVTTWHLTTPYKELWFYGRGYE